MLGTAGREDVPVTRHMAARRLGSYVPERVVESNGAPIASTSIAVATAGGMTVARQPAGKGDICKARCGKTLPRQVQAAKNLYPMSRLVAMLGTAGRENVSATRCVATRPLQVHTAKNLNPRVGHSNLVG